ncbi:P13 family porin [Brucepastera parasyntrophica]|uniref:P13 family porin n=1 Tax=Brucepastera parasyntrophica TaxID=2880008 RepID=UPI00210BEB46|nr:P13 family porin [Brucepastera parasyntrophica]ULQ59489.1 P13 family porin [Brucepastera parasyntrophica]
MKQFCLAVILAGMCFFPLLGEDAAVDAAATDGSSSDIVFDINQLIKKGLFKNKDAIAEKAQFLQEKDQLSLIADNKKSGVGPFFLNFFLGFGIGSFVQKDLVGGFIMLGADIASIAMMIPFVVHMGRFFAYFLILPVIAMADPDSDLAKDFSAAVDDAAKYSGLFIAGGVLMLASRIFGSVKPWTHASKWNSTLNSALSQKAKITIGIEPVIMPDQYGFKVAIHL